MNQDINAILEMITALKDLAICVRQVSADGTINLADLPALMALVAKANDLTTAIKDADEIPAEVKDLSAEEATQVVAALFAAIKEVKAL